MNPITRIPDEYNANKRVSHCTASKRTLVQWHMVSTDLPDIMFVEFFCEKYQLAMDKYIMVWPVGRGGSRGFARTLLLASKRNLHRLTVHFKCPTI